MLSVEELRQKLISTIDTSKNTEDGELKEMIAVLVGKEHLSGNLSLKERLRLERELFNSIRGLGILENLLDDPEITEIMVNGCESIFIEKKGRLFRHNENFTSREKLTDVIQAIVSRANKRVNESTPIVDTRLPDGSRVNVVLNPIAINGPIVTIRKFPEKAITMEDLVSFGSVTEEAAEFLKDLVISGRNMVISGATGSGKTTFLNALTGFIPSTERIVTIEDSAELQIKGIENLVRMECRQANVEGENEVTIRDLIKTALRQRPDRIIVGEVRGAECLDMLQAMNTGHDGSLSTGHANSTYDMLTRLETMVLMGTDMPLQAIKSQIASAVDVLVHLGRFKDGSRKVMEIAELTGLEGASYILNPLFSVTEGVLTPTGNRLIKKGKGNL
ncbi:MAG: CpaF family protein [Parasporobacterium sp.]|nr:CpaF family protein [Parasporobacterium sp.]